MLPPDCAGADAPDLFPRERDEVEPARSPERDTPEALLAFDALPCLRREGEMEFPGE
jgi:hypothetical protein